jgi:hypothetical protein
MAITGWMLSAALAVWLPGMRDALPRSLLGAGWLLAFGALGCAFAGSREIFASTADASSSTALTSGTGAAKAAPWVLLAALGAIAASLLAGL